METIRVAGRRIYDSIISRNSRVTKKNLEAQVTQVNDDDDMYISKEKNKSIHRVVIYGSEDSDISAQIGTQGICEMCFYVAQASISVDVCVPSLASKDITSALVGAATKHDMKIRIAIHKSSNFRNLPLLSQNGIEVKVISSELLEHDFVLIDALSEENALAILGSIDHDIRFRSNKNHQILTGEPCVIRSLRREFERVWNSNGIIHT